MHRSTDTLSPCARSWAAAALAPAVGASGNIIRQARKPMSSTTPAGWYPDGQTPDHERFWDGAQWTEQYRPVTPAFPTGPAPYAPQYGAPQYGTPQYGAPQYGAAQYGAPAQQYPGRYYQAGPRYPNPAASASLTLALFAIAIDIINALIPWTYSLVALSYVLLAVVGILLILAIVFGHVGLSKAKFTNSGRGPAITGFVLAYVFLALGITGQIFRFTILRGFGYY